MDISRVTGSKAMNPLLQVLAWIVLGLALLYYSPFFQDTDIPVDFWVKQGIHFCVMIGLFYLNTQLLIPRLLFRKNGIAIYVLVLLVLLIAVQLAMNWMYQHHGPHEIMNRFPKGAPGDRFGHGRRPRHFEMPMMEILLVGIGVIISLGKRWQREVALREEMQREKTETELSYLKAQINPHFFFNTLNTIYAYTLTDGETARETISNLSKMMRYVLYDAQHVKTTLQKEIGFIREYVGLMKLRLTPNMTVRFHYPEDAGEVEIAPMLFMPFVENAFKHGPETKDPGHIDINIAKQDKLVTLEVINSINRSASAPAASPASGIGLDNTRKRLELLYPGKYELTAGPDEKGEFRVVLKLQTDVTLHHR